MIYCTSADEFEEKFSNQFKLHEAKVCVNFLHKCFFEREVIFQLEKHFWFLGEIFLQFLEKMKALLLPRIFIDGLRKERSNAVIIF